MNNFFFKLEQQMTASSASRCPLQLIKCIQCEKLLQDILTSWAILVLKGSCIVNNAVIEKEEK